MAEDQRYVVVGVAPGQAAQVLKEAEKVAHARGAELVCAFVQRGKDVVEEQPKDLDPTGSSKPLPGDEDVDSLLREAIGKFLSKTGVKWYLRYLKGAPSTALSALAEELDAEMIVVGTTQRGRGNLREYFNRSVGVQLSTRQKRPVLVIPVNPATGKTPAAVAAAAETAAIEGAQTPAS